MAPHRGGQEAVRMPAIPDIPPCPHPLVGASMGSHLPHISPQAGLQPLRAKAKQIMSHWRKRRGCKEWGREGVQREQQGRGFLRHRFPL